MWLILLILLNVSWNTVSDARHTKFLHKDDQVIGYAKVGDRLTKREESDVQTSDASSSHSKGQEEKIFTEMSNANQGVGHLDDKKQQTQTSNSEGQRETTSLTIKPHEVNQTAIGPQQKQSENTIESLGKEAGKGPVNLNQLESPTSQKGGQLDDKTHYSTQGNVTWTSIGTQTATNQSSAQEQTNLKDDKAGQAQQVSDSSKTSPFSHETSPQENRKSDNKGNAESDQGQDAPEEGEPVPAVDLSKGRPTGVGYDTSTNEVFPNPAEENAATQTPVPEFPNESEPSGTYDPSQVIPGISEVSPDEGMGTGYDDMSMSFNGKSSSKRVLKKENEKQKSGDDI